MSIDELALFGGEPLFAEPQHVGRPNIGNRERVLERVAGALDRRWLTNDGELVQEFERKVAQVTGARHAVAVSNATVGLQLAAMAAGLHGEVIVPSFTFVGTAHALSWLGIKPVFCDIDPQTHNLDPAAVRAAVTERTTGILGVHLWGRPCPHDELDAIAREHDLVLLYDAAHALGCSWRGKPIGGLGNASVFSFHATKVANAGEGGAVTTDDDELDARLRRMRNFGFSDYDAVSSLGTNAKMHELSAAMGVTSLEALDDFVAVERTNHAAYERELSDVQGVRLVHYDDAERNNWHYVILELDDSVADLRDDVLRALHAENVLARRYFHPGCHRMQPYHDPALSLPVTEAVARRVIAMPNGSELQTRDVVKACSVLRTIFGDLTGFRARLEPTPHAVGGT